MNNKISKICHLADIHIRKIPTRNEEYENVFNSLISSLNIEKPDRIVIVGDLVHDYLDLQGEQLILTNKFLKKLSEIAPVRIVRGNHDCRKKNLKRVDSIEAIVKTLDNNKIIYYNKTGFYEDENVIWCVWHHGELKNNPWLLKEGKNILKNRDSNKIYIDLFHDPITGSKSTTGFELKSNSFFGIKDFKGDFSFFGDIHKMQFLDKNNTKAYSGSLIAQDFSEGDDNFHGYILWDIINKTHKEIPIENEFSFKNIKITPFTDFDDLDFEIENHTNFMKIRFLWLTLPQARTKENERKLINFIKTKYSDSQIINISHKNQFLEEDKIDVNNDVELNDINNIEIQQNIFKEYLKKIGVDDKTINDVINLDNEISNEIKTTENNHISWDIVKFGGINFMSYDKLDVDWKDMNGLYQITGMNTHGKTTIMKLISYILYNKTLETETKKKFGDIRYVNNRNDATSCSGYMVIDVNGEYYGLKRKTEINKNKSGEIINVSTTLNYYLLSTPDDDMNDENIIDKLDDDNRLKTQKKIESILGNYDNFIRIVMTTSDTLNRILSNDMAVFIDSILFDAGLDIFDKKLDVFKLYQKRINEKGRINCNVESVEEQNRILGGEIDELNNKLNAVETIELPNIQNRISNGKKYIEEQTKKLYRINSEIYNLNIEDVNYEIKNGEDNILEIKKREKLLNDNAKLLIKTYDEKKLESLILKRDEHKQKENENKFKIKDIEYKIREKEHDIEILNGNIFRLKNDGSNLKTEITDLKKSKICSLCGQPINKPEHLEKIKNLVQLKENEMFNIAKKIKIIETEEKNNILNEIEVLKNEVINIKNIITKNSIDMEFVLVEIGKLTNDKNDVEKYNEIKKELDSIPLLIQNEELKIAILKQKIVEYENSLLQIEENKKTERNIILSKEKLQNFEIEENKIKENIFIIKNFIRDKEIQIKNNKELISNFEKQEYRDKVMGLYKNCVHRDGIPKQLLVNYLIPKINKTIENILSVSPFKVWLDENDLKPKLAYNSRPTAIIDTISASGKERTFASIVLKFALNQINIKSKPDIFLLDEVMGKLDEDSVEEFIEILQLIKNYTKRVLIIEHKVNIEPDYIIDVIADDNGISSLKIT
ncbi:MAG TPA: metallophosphoesterase [archaeon]|nr:metallophosphoesterase [archaeon]